MEPADPQPSSDEISVPLGGGTEVLRVVAVAQGIVMQTRGVGEAEALDILQAAAERDGTTLIQVARGLVDGPR